MSHWDPSARISTVAGSLVPALNGVFEVDPTHVFFAGDGDELWNGTGWTASPNSGRGG